MRGSGCSGGAFDLFDYPTTYDGVRRGRDRGRAELGQGRQGRHGRASRSRASPSSSPPAPGRRTSRPSRRCRSPTTSTRAPATPAASSTRASRSPGSRSAWTTPSRRPAGGQPWAASSSKRGDKNCIANQKLRLQTQDALAAPEGQPVPDSVAVRTPRARARGSSAPRCPIFLVGPVPGRADRRPLRRGHQVPRTATRTCGSRCQNGVHADSLGPSTITRWAEFLEALRGATRIPNIPSLGHRPERRALPVPRGRRAAPVEQSRFASYHRASPPRRRSSSATRACAS